MNLQQLRTMIAEMELQVEELQRSTFTINNQLMRAQIMAEELAKKGQNILDWATEGTQFKNDSTEIRTSRSGN